MSIGVLERKQAIPYLARGLLLLGVGVTFLFVLGSQEHHYGALMAEALGMFVCVFFGTRELNRGLRMEIGWPTAGTPRRQPSKVRK